VRALAGVLALAFASVTASSPGPCGEIRSLVVPDQQQLIRPQEILIWNSATQEIHVFISSDAAPESMYSIAPGDTAKFSDDASQEYEIRVVTGGRVVRYRLQARKRYQIYWNLEVQMWDVAQIRPR
jgi:hypothetical protein